MDSFLNVLKTSLGKLDVITDDASTPNEVADAWGKAFKDPFFDGVIEGKSITPAEKPAAAGLLSAEAFKEDGELRGNMPAVEIRGNERFG